MTSTQGLTLRIVLGGLGIGCQFTTGGWSIDTIATNFFVDFVVFTVRHSVGILLGVTKGIGFKQRLVMMFGTCRHDCRGIAERRSQQQHHHPPPSDPVRGRSNEHRGGSGGSGGSSVPAIQTIVVLHGGGQAAWTASKWRRGCDAMMQASVQ